MDVQKKLIFSVLQYLSGVSESAPDGVDVESLEVAIQCLSQAFSVDHTDEEQQKSLAIGAPLDQVFKYGIALDASEDTPITSLLKQAVDAVGQKRSNKSPEEQLFDQKFEKYLASLKEKGFFAGTEEGSEQYNERVEKARDRLKAEEEKMLQVRKEQAEAKKAEGNTLLSQSKTNEAIACYSEAIELYPKNAVYYANRAAAYTSLREHEKAIEDCIAAVKIDPQYSKAFSRLGLAYFSLGRYHEAVHSYERAFELDPSNENVKKSLEIAKKKDQEKLAAEGPDGRTCTSHGPAHGHQHAGGHGHSHDAGAGAQRGMPDLAGLMNNPAIQNMVQGMQQGGEQQGGGLPDFSSMLNNPDMMSAASQMLNNPGVGNLLNNPAIMNMASQVMSNPDMLNSMLSNFGGFGGAQNQDKKDE